MKTLLESSILELDDQSTRNAQSDNTTQMQMVFGQRWEIYRKWNDYVGSMISIFMYLILYRKYMLCYHCTGPNHSISIYTLPKTDLYRKFVSRRRRRGPQGRANGVSNAGTLRGVQNITRIVRNEQVPIFMKYHGLCF